MHEGHSDRVCLELDRFKNQGSRASTFKHMIWHAAGRLEPVNIPGLFLLNVKLGVLGTGESCLPALLGSVKISASKIRMHKGQRPQGMEERWLQWLHLNQRFLISRSFV